MGDSSYIQASFLGGEWSPFYQGRADNPKYKSAMNVCQNAYPIEEGACPRRPGFALAAPTRDGAAGRVLPFAFSEANPITLAPTDGFLRFLSGTSFCIGTDIQTVVAITQATPAVIVLSGALPWVTGNAVEFQFAANMPAGDCDLLRNRTFTITATGDNSFSIADPITGVGVNGALLTWGGAALQVARITEIATPYVNGAWENLRVVQAENQAVLLCPGYQPQVLTATLPAAGVFQQFTLIPASFLDGPYLDPVTDVVTAYNALSGTITLTFSFNAWSPTTAYTLGSHVSYAGAGYQLAQGFSLGNEPDISPTYWTPITNGSPFTATGFVQTDVGRLIRLYSQPPQVPVQYPLPNPTEDNQYAIGDTVTAYESSTSPGTFYTKMNSAANPNDATPLNAATWAITPEAAVWTWGYITSVLSATSITVNLIGPNMVPANTGSLAQASFIAAVRLGTYSNTTAWPRAGCYHEGRLWLTGAIDNRSDSSNSNDLFNMAPTTTDGTVGDSNAISATFNASDVNPIFWMEPSAQGIVCGTQAGEWLIHASALNDPITPTSIQAHRVTRYGCANVLPLHTGLAIVFVQKFQRKVMEFLADVFTGKYLAPNLTLAAKHLTTTGIEEIAYQEEIAPIIWSRMGNGTLAGATYRRITTFSQEEPAFVGWHHHPLGSGRSVESICVGPSVGGTLDTLTMVTEDPVTAINYIEAATPLFDIDATLMNAWFVDSSIVPTGAALVTYGGQEYVRFYGLWYLNGFTVSVWAAGLDCGDYLVTSGHVDVPLGADNGLFSLAWLASVSASGVAFGALASEVDLTTIASGPPVTTVSATLSNPPLPGFAGNDSTSIFIDWPNNRYFLFTRGSSSTGTLGTINVYNLATGALLISQTVTQILGASANDSWINYDVGQLPAAAIGPDGNLIWFSSDQNGGVVRKVAPATLTLLASFGTSAGAAGNNTVPSAVNMIQPFSVAFATGGGHYFVEATDAGFSNSQLGWMNTDTMAFVAGSTYSFAEGQVSLCAGAQGATLGVVFGIGTRAHAFTATNLYRTAITAGVVTTSIVAAIPATAIDPAWTTYNGVVGLLYDPIDNNLICGFDGGGSVAHRYYMAKINAATGAILWAVQVNNLPIAGINESESYYNAGSRLSNTQTYSFISPTSTGSSNGVPGYPLYTINTLTGATSIQTIYGVHMTGTQVYDAVSGTIFGFGSFTYHPTNPATPVGTPPSFSLQWFTFHIGSASPTTTAVATKSTFPCAIGFTYTTQGQGLRPVAEQDTGSQPGPASGKTRRTHMFSALIEGSVAGACSVGTSFSGTLRPMNYTTANRTPIPVTSLYSGTWQATLEDDYGFDSMFGWQVTRPYPTTIVSYSAFLHTQPR